MSLLTIGLPVYNAEKYVKDCITSILNQTYSDFELLIVDDGSTDRSISIIETFYDSRIELIQDGENKGLIARLNQITNLTETKYLARMDADDIMHPERVEKQINRLEKNPDIDVLGTNIYSINKKNQIRGVRFSFDNYTKTNELIKVDSFVHPTIIAKTKWFAENPYYEKAVRIEDKELWDRTRKDTNFYILKKPLLFYREYGENYYKKYQASLASFFSVSKRYFKKNRYKKSIYWVIEGFYVSMKYVIYKIGYLLEVEDLLIENRSNYINEDKLAKAIRNLKKSISNINS